MASGIALSTTALRPARRRVSGNGVVTAAATIVLAAIVFIALFPQVITSADPLEANVVPAFLPPSAEYPFGTDQLGRDLFSRVIHGARSSITLGIGATLVGLLGGIIIGVAAGLSRGWLDRFLSRALDILFAFPDLLLAIVAVAILGTGLPTLLLAIGIAAVPGYARVLRSQVKVVRNAGYVESAVGLGRSPLSVIGRHVVPNSIGPLLVLATIGVGQAIIFGSALSFVGLGAQPPTPEWGLMLAESRDYLSFAPWLGLWPGVFLAVTVIAVNVVGRAVQRRFVSGAQR